MANKELRKMNRTELIEIIYALQQNERTLREENEKLQKQLDDKIVRMEKAGSIAEAALGLNHIFEDAEKAAQQYLDSLRVAASHAMKDADLDIVQEAEADVVQTADLDSVQEADADVVQTADLDTVQEAEVDVLQDADLDIVQIADSDTMHAAEKDEDNRTPVDTL